MGPVNPNDNGWHGIREWMPNIWDLTPAGSGLSDDDKNLIRNVKASVWWTIYRNTRGLGFAIGELRGVNDTTSIIVVQLEGLSESGQSGHVISSARVYGVGRSHSRAKFSSNRSPDVEVHRDLIYESYQVYFDRDSTRWVTAKGADINWT